MQFFLIPNGGQRKIFIYSILNYDFFFCSSGHSQCKQFEFIYRIYKAHCVSVRLNSYCLFNDGKSFTSKSSSCLNITVFKD